METNLEKGEVKIAGSVGRKGVEAYEIKEKQGRLFRAQEDECNLWLTQNVNPRKTASVMVMLEQMVETRVWKRECGNESVESSKRLDRRRMQSMSRTS